MTTAVAKFSFIARWPLTSPGEMLVHRMPFSYSSRLIAPPREFIANFEALRSQDYDLE